MVQSDMKVIGTNTVGGGAAAAAGFSCVTLFS